MGLPYFCNDGTSVVLQQMMMVNKPTEKAVNEQNEQDVIAAIEKAMNESPPNLTMLENLKQRRLPYTQMKVFEVRAYSVGLLALVRTGELWRMVTPAFIHLSLLHLLMNMMAFKNLGCATEFIRGTPKYLTLCLILAVASSCGQFVWDGPKFGGMSGVLFGLVGYIWVKGKTQPRLGLGLSSRGVTFVGLWLFLCIAGVFGPVANAAHVVGLIAGIIVGGRQAVYKKLGLTRDGPKAGSG